MQTYEVLETGFLAGTHYKAGDRVSLTPAEAKYFLPPYSSRLRLVAPSDSPAGSRPEGAAVARKGKARD